MRKFIKIIVIAANRNRNKVASNETASVAKAGIMTEDAANKIKEDEPNKVPISQEAINTLLICKKPHEDNYELININKFPLQVLWLLPLWASLWVSFVAKMWAASRQNAVGQANQSQRIRCIPLRKYH